MVINLVRASKKANLLYLPSLIIRLSSHILLFNSLYPIHRKIIIGSHSGQNKRYVYLIKIGEYDTYRKKWADYLLLLKVWKHEIDNFEFILQKAQLDILYTLFYK